MKFISIHKFAEKTLKINEGLDRKKLIQSLHSALQAKENGACCIVCGAPIWAAGSAITGTNMCFTCTTGETDDNSDYEIV